MTNIDSLKVLEWNINSRSTGKRMPDYVCSEILSKDPDIAVLVEFKGEKNLQIINDRLSNYNIYYQQPVNTGNGVLIALSKNTFPDIIDENNIESKKEYDENIPDYLGLHTTWNNQLFNIVGIKVLVENEKRDTNNNTENKSTTPDLDSRKKQIAWIIENTTDNNPDKVKENTIIIGDFNYGPHRNEYRRTKQINWQDILELIYISNNKTNNYPKYSRPYSPLGVSFRSYNLDWLITQKSSSSQVSQSRKISVKEDSEYNQLDWSFGQYNSRFKFVDGYLAPDGNFIRTDAPFPDHAIFTAEIELI
ncbi:endonuclease/exonuclease/phosphatase family protein [Companilactobacillus muriivasis]|uniref:endonuclease/exonuclease/phosphatase family protein n=1 Tax=Companilactobacillus muriivasis TaxID=3081444 RepID=UPI0030C76FA3